MDINPKYNFSKQGRVLNSATDWNIPTKEDLLREIDQDSPVAISAAAFVNNDKNIDSTLITAALSGKFYPASLIESYDEKTKLSILNALAPLCNIETAGTEVTWMLKADVRKDVLLKLRQENDLSAFTSKALAPLDFFGKLMIDILNGVDIGLTDLNQEQLLALSCVLENLQGLNIKKPDIKEVEELVDLRTFADNYYHLTKSFTGRKDELKTLHTFLNKPHQTWESLLLTGAGGTGKSTLLAKFCHDLIDAKAATLIMIDFDRPGMDPQDTAWLLDELTRQIGVQYPAHKDVLKSVIESNRLMQDEYRNARTSMIESNEYDKISYRALNVIKDVLYYSEGSKPVLIVLDTIEEVVQQKSYEKLAGWLSIVADNFRPLQVKVILSGRVQNEIGRFNEITKTIALNEFDKPTAAEFLKKLNTNAENITAITNSKHIPLRPLELKLISRITNEQDVPFVTLEKELFESNEMNVSGDFFTGMIYRRVLNRIQDPVVRKVAYPGLVLRYITPDLIKILEPILDLPEMDDAARKQVCVDLETYGWLAFKGDFGEVRHRKDLRRIMVRMIMKQQRKVADEIRNAAIAYFDARHTPTDIAESLYHRLMLTQSREDLEYFTPDELKSSAQSILPDVTDLPKSAGVLLQFIDSGKIAPADIEFLPDKYFIKIYEKTGKKLVSRQQFSQAYELYLRAKRMGIRLSANGNGLNDRWEQEMLFCLGEFDDLRKLKSYQSFPSQSVTLLHFLHYVFPAMLICPADVDQHIAERLLAECVKDSKSLSKVLTGPENLTVITRLSYALSVINNLGYLSPSARENLQKLVRILDTGYKPGHAERSRLILHCLAFRQFPKRYFMSLANLKLRIEWFDLLRRNMTGQADFLLDPMFRILGATQPTTARAFLNRIDSMEDLRNAWYNVSVDIVKLSTENRYEIIRGPNALLRYPCKSAIYDALGQGMSPEKLRLLLEQIINAKITDIRMLDFQSAIDRKADWLEPLIELVDREQSLGDLINRLSEAGPANAKLCQVNEMYFRWEKAVSAILRDIKNYA